MKRGVVTKGSKALGAFIIAAAVIFLGGRLFSNDLLTSRLDKFVEDTIEKRKYEIGYPLNQNVDLGEFYKWYVSSGLCDVNMNNVGDPRQHSALLNTHEFENEVIDFFAPLYGFSKDEAWGFITHSGTDGNMHGMYFGVKQLLGQTNMMPICYVSQEAHYSIKKVADVQNLELRLIKTDETGRMITSEFEKALDPSKPALVVIAMGTTFKGGIDDQAAINAVLQKKKPIAVYRHLDAALFGGYLPFTRFKDLVNRQVHYFDSIAVSGHKFFGFDEPSGIFITTKKTLDGINPFKVAYLNQAVPTITCSRNALSAIKFWWKIQKTGVEGFKKQAEAILDNAQYLEDQLKSIGYQAWQDDYSNTVYFRRPSQAIMDKYGLAPDHDDRLGGDLAHIIVMQHLTRNIIDEFIKEVKAAK